jgi:hypothetical protein
MSGEGPESIPTSADPRSRRPTKKRALTPLTEQAASVEALFARPDQEIRIPDGSSAKRPRAGAAPPEIVANVQGSSAGAGSGEFHVYKASRRREYERLRAMEGEAAAERAQAEFEKERAERERRDEERTRKNREKREKMKNRKAKKGKGGGGGGGGDGGNSGNGGQAKSALPNHGNDHEEEPNSRDDGQTSQNGKGGTDSSRNDGPDTTPSTGQPTGLLIHDDDD